MIVKKAGTILLNLTLKKVGLVYRRNLNDYTFPKGHLEAYESLQECAVRETEEETLRANHLISEKEIFIEKYTTPKGVDVENYLYIAIDDGPTTKDIALEDREELYWASPDEVKDLLSYDDLKEIWEKSFSRISEIIK